MALLFKDQLRTIHTSGLYTLRGYVNSTWLDIYHLAGPTTGSITVDVPNYHIAVDTDIFLPGQSYRFKWVDMNGVESMETVLPIPASEYLEEEDSSYVLQESGDRLIIW